MAGRPFCVRVRVELATYLPRIKADTREKKRAEGRESGWAFRGGIKSQKRKRWEGKGRGEGSILSVLLGQCVANGSGSNSTKVMRLRG